MRWSFGTITWLTQNLCFLIYQIEHTIQSNTYLFSTRSLPLLPHRDMDPLGSLGLEVLVTSPRNDAVTDDMDWLSLHSCPDFPSITKRKNGEQMNIACMFVERTLFFSLPLCVYNLVLYCHWERKLLQRAENVYSEINKKEELPWSYG